MCTQNNRQQATGNRQQATGKNHKPPTRLKIFNVNIWGLKLYLLFFLLFFPFLLFSQQDNFNDHSYYYKNQKIQLHIDRNYINIFVNDSFQKNPTDFSLFKSFRLKNIIKKSSDNRSITRWAKLEFKNTPTQQQYDNAIANLSSKQDIFQVSKYYEKGNGESIGTSDIFYVKLDKLSDTLLLKNKAINKNVKIIGPNKFMPLWFKLSSETSNFNSVYLSNYFYESGDFIEIDPSFMFDFGPNCTNDPRFDDLWGLENPLPDYFKADINACEAWNISEGNGVNVAVVDKGIYPNHNDLAANVSSISYNTIDGGNAVWQGHHGTYVAGIIAAIKNNNLQVVGCAPQSTLLDVSNPMQASSTISEELADGINWAWMNGADVINNSWGDQGGLFYNYMHSPVLENAISNALNEGRNGKGCIVIFSSGNQSPDIDYPAYSMPDILCVGAADQVGERAGFSGYGSELDVVAPGSQIYSTEVSNHVSYPLDGTSFSAPFVSGIAALILSVNPNLSGAQVRNIIEITCQKRDDAYNFVHIPERLNGTWNSEMGYGFVDAYAAVQLAQSIDTQNLDLYTKNSSEDLGLEPDTFTEAFWESPDIWIRNQQDSSEENENPEYDPNNPSYVYVRVKNKSFQTSTGNEQLKLYWAKASTSIKWPFHWNGNMYEQGVLLGDIIGTLNIPILAPGEETILEFSWPVPNPNDYAGIISDPWHFCLLSRIVATNDPMTTPEGTFIPDNVKNNNNIAWKNVSVIDAEPNGFIGAAVSVENPSNRARVFNLEFVPKNKEPEKPIYKEAEVGIDLGDNLYNAWKNGGEIMDNIRNTRNPKEKIVVGNHAMLKNIHYPANGFGTLYLKFNFLTKEVSNKTSFTYRVIQRDASTNKIMGGETYVINRKNNRKLFAAEAQTTGENENMTLIAESIDEPATYNWYDPEGNLIYSGQELPLDSQVYQEYKLEVIADADGYKDYGTIELTDSPFSIESMSPNPASTNVDVCYYVDNADSVYLMVTSINSGVSNNYILDETQSTTSIDISSYATGEYVVSLVRNGEIVDTKNLLKN